MFSTEAVSGPLPDAPLELLIADVWRRSLKRDVVGAEEDFFEIGGDSLLATEMLMELQTIVHRPIKPSDVGTRLTIRGLAQSFAEWAAAKGEVGCAVKEGEGTPTFLCHGDFLGWGFYGFRLAEMLKTAGPVHLLHSLLDDRTGVDSIEKMVSLHMPYVERVAPSGPVRLIGYCHGGLAALELARRLEAAGRTVEKIVLLDTISLNARTPLRMAEPVVRLAANGGAGHGSAQARPQRDDVAMGAVDASAVGRSHRRLPGRADPEEGLDAGLGRIAAHHLLPGHGQVRPSRHQGRHPLRGVRGQCRQARICRDRVALHREHRRCAHGARQSRHPASASTPPRWRTASTQRCSEAAYASP